MDRVWVVWPTECTLHEKEGEEETEEETRNTPEQDARVRSEARAADSIMR
jgi:hypothetical protein